MRNYKKTSYQTTTQDITRNRKSEKWDQRARGCGRRVLHKCDDPYRL